MKRILIVLIMAVGLFLGTYISVAEIQAQPVAQPVAQPTYTPNPTLTPRPTYTDLPTYTPNPTFTPCPPTPYPTSTIYPTQAAYPIQTPYPTSTSYPDQFCEVQSAYYVSPSGNDSNSGSISQPFQTIQKALDVATSGDIVYLREGEYYPGLGGFKFKASDVTLTNYPGEQAVIKILNFDWDHMAFRCETTLWVTPKADDIRIIGSDVSPKTLSNGVVSRKGIVIQGPNWDLDGTRSIAPGISVAGCDYWEVAGVDFVEVGYGIFLHKRIDQPVDLESQSSDYWYIHDNRVYGFYGESGMQFNGNHNLIENNEIYKVFNLNLTQWGCQHLAVLGHHNIVRNNFIDKLGSSEWCNGILIEWDIADFGVYEQNIIANLDIPIYIYGGDNNLIHHNLIYTDSSPEWTGGIRISSGDNESHCDTEPSVIKPPEDPSHPDYSFYYEPRNCESWGNLIYNNTIDGFVESIRFYPDVPQITTIRNNALSGWTRDAICHYEASGNCLPLSANVIEDHNAFDDFGFLDIENHNYHLQPDSPLIDAGVDVGLLYYGPAPDIGAFEFVE